MRKIITFIYVFVLIVFLKFVITFITNEMFIAKYNKGDYEKNLVKSLFVLNFYEKYIAYYNYGNLLYQIGYYEDAIEEYNKALEYDIPKERVCDVRINLSLSMTNMVNEEMDIEEQIKLLEDAQEVLYEDDCAEPNGGGGSSSDAEGLDEELEEKQDELEEEQQEEGESDGESGKTEEEKQEEQDKHDELEDRNDSANESRQDELDEMEDYDDYEYYSGKKW